MSETYTQFEEMARRLFEAHCPQRVVEEAEARVFPAALWAAVEEAGIPLVLLEEAKGGIGAAIADAMAIPRVAGRFAAPGPLIETMTANWLLGRAGLEVTPGPVALVFLDAPLPAGLGAGAVWRPQKPVGPAAWPDAAKTIVLVGEADARAVIAVTAPAAWTLAPGRDNTGEPRDRLSAAEVPLLAMGEIASACAFGEAKRLAALLRAGQILGALEWALERTVAYSSERSQFGREIAKFQAVQQMLADAAGAVVAGIAVTDAAAAAGIGAGGLPLLAAARSRLGDSIDTVTAVTHQVHGAIGFSREYGLNFRTRRLMAWRDDYGAVAEWRRLLAQHVLDRPMLGQAASGPPGDALWPTLTAAAAAR